MLLPLTVRHWTFRSERPKSTAVQLVPLLVDRKTPPAQVPAKILLPLTKRQLTLVFAGRPELTAVQFVSLFLSMNIPELRVPAIRFDPSTKIELTMIELTRESVNPELTGVQLRALSEERKTPKLVPA